MDAILMAGGYGTRAGEIASRHNCKPLIPLAGKPCIEWVLRELHELDLRNIFIVADREEIIPAFKDIIRREKLSNAVIHRHFGKHSSGEAIMSLIGQISDGFFLTYGNNIVPHEFYSRMIDSCKNNECGIALYEVQTSNSKRVATFNENNVTRLAQYKGGDQHYHGSDSMFFDKPFLLNMEFVNYLQEENLSSSRALINWAEEGMPVNYFLANFPPEFHYAWEIPILEKYIVSGLLSAESVSLAAVPQMRASVRSTK